MDDSQMFFHIYVSSEEVFIQPNKSKLLSINRDYGVIKEGDRAVLSQKAIYSTWNANAILGVIKVITSDYLLIVTQSQSIGFIESAEIFLIKEVEFIYLADPNNNIQAAAEQPALIAGLKKMLQLGFYYSFDYDLTLPQPKQTRNKAHSDLSTSSNEKFFWNKELYKPFQSAEAKQVCVPLICGYVNMFCESVNGKQLEFILITRRSKYHAGTRYLTRGIDDEGHCANYCETEQIVKYSNKTLSFIQLRGSAPIFFQQGGLTAQTEITRSTELTIQAFSKHLDEVIKDYSMLYLVNLLNKLKQGEQVITEAIENQIKLKSPNSVLRYNFFDFQNNCPYDKYDKIEDFMQQVNSIADIFQFNLIEDQTGKREISQGGTIRTNCLDCLDRTNVIQTRISWLIFEKMLTCLKVPTIGLFVGSFFAPSTSKIQDMFKMLWVENGDNISIQYAGTASTISTVTKTGGHGFFGFIKHGLVSITRVYQGSFEDSLKQKCFDILLQKHLSAEIHIDPSIEEQLTQCSQQYTTYQDITIFIGSWNIGGKELTEADSLDEWLSPPQVKNTLPDVYIIGLQEIVVLNAKNLLYYGNNNQSLYWEGLIQRHLNQKRKYVLIKTIDLVGIMLIAFVEESKKGLVTNLDQMIIKTGLMGSLGNKGSCLIRFNILNSSIAFACCHMSAGKEYTDARRKEMVDLLNCSFEKYPKVPLKDYDLFFIFGDLNSRLDVETEVCASLIQEKKYQELIKNDQLNGYKYETSIMNLLDEGTIAFAPTYKYILNSNEYDITNRTPSYCDRILHKKGSKATPLVYNRSEYTISDHRPIHGLFKVSVGSINKEIRNQIAQGLKPQLTQNQQDTTLKQPQINFNMNLEENYFKSQQGGQGIQQRQHLQPIPSPQDINAPYNLNEAKPTSIENKEGLEKGDNTTTYYYNKTKGAINDMMTWFK